LRDSLMKKNSEKICDQLLALDRELDLCLERLTEIDRVDDSLLGMFLLTRGILLLAHGRSKEQLATFLCYQTNYVLGLLQTPTRKAGLKK